MRDWTQRITREYERKAKLIFMILPPPSQVPASDIDYCGNAGFLDQ